MYSENPAPPGAERKLSTLIYKVMVKRRALTPSQRLKEGKMKKALKIFFECKEMEIDESEAYRIIAKEIKVCRNTAKRYVTQQVEAI